MIRIALSFLAGILLLQLYPQLPSPLWSLPLVLSAFLLWLTTAIRVPLFILLGFMWGCWQADVVLDGRLPEDLSGRDLILTGWIAELPQTHGDRERFVFKIDRISFEGNETEPVDWRGSVRLWWREPPVTLAAGLMLRLHVRLYPPDGWLNPGGFDRERWLFVNGIHATGYVLRGERLGAASTGTHLHAWLQRLRQALRNRIELEQGQASGEALLKALLIGDRSGLDDRHWEVFRITGTSHLVAISGLHIGLIAGVALFVVGRCWRASSRLCELWPATRAAAAVALMVAAGYAALAGFSVPTQRALVMLLLALGALMVGRNVAPAQLLAGALLTVLLVDSRAVLSAGTWLSFGAVAAILLMVAGRSRLTPVRGWWTLQWGLWIALTPLLAGWGLPISLISPLVNLVAVPWFTLVLVPLSFVPLPMIGWADPMASAILKFDIWLADLTYQMLELAASAGNGMSWQLPSISTWFVGLALAGIAVLLSPLALRYRLLGVTLLMPLAFGSPRDIPDGGLRVAVLDVGQGTSVVVMTPHRTLVYDLGPRFMSGFNAAEAVVLPFLENQGIRRIDRLILSHDDADHAGAWRGFLDRIAVDDVISGQSDQLGTPVHACIDGETWEWDGVRFELFRANEADRAKSDNDASCVLRIDHPKARFLLTGDISAKVERLILRRRPEWLPVEFVLVPHHGSRTSSSAAFVEAAEADFALVSSGHGNRYGFPHPEVAERWRQSGAQVLETGSTGAQIVEVTSGHGISMARYRDLARKYWHRR